MQKIMKAVMLVVMFGALSWASDNQSAESGEWWKRNPLAVEALSNEWIWHTEATYSYENINKSEQYEESMHNAKLYGALRKNRWTNHMAFTFNEDETKGRGENEGLEIEDRYVQFDEYVSYAVDPNWEAQVGYIYSNDNTRQIDNRHTVYTGAGYTHEEKAYILSFFASVGYEDVDYMVETDTDGGALLYAKQSYTRPLTENITFNEDFAYVYYLEDSGIFRTDLNVYVDIAVAQHVALQVGYSQRYNSATVPGTSKRQSRQKLGIKFSF